jgi:hypothetical protein
MPANAETFVNSLTIGITLRRISSQPPYRRALTEPQVDQLMIGYRCNLARPFEAPVILESGIDIPLLFPSRILI